MTSNEELEIASIYDKLAFAVSKLPPEHHCGFDEVLSSLDKLLENSNDYVKINDRYWSRDQARKVYGDKYDK